MSKFLTGKDLEEKLTDIIWNAKKYIVVVSPYIQLDDYVKHILEKVKLRHNIKFYLLFGKNENSRQQSISVEDFGYFTEFKNITILYNKDLHAKHYCNENEGLITSLNLYDYSMINNVEYGVHFNNGILESLFKETESFTYDLIHKKSDVIFLKKPHYTNHFLGLKKNYLESRVIFDISEGFFENNGYYKKKKLIDFDLELETSYEKKFDVKPTRDIAKKQSNQKKSKALYRETIGYCIRTGEKIPFNPERPYCFKAFKSWSQFANYNYAENYCHKTGKESFGKTSMNKPVL